ncbi:hypothetical protein F5B20DRAFT_225058 [Whalleya microplaca]|nr:hypothetical protein F5B20DRAFT_225058 [Whalleya microplaca]
MYRFLLVLSRLYLHMVIEFALTRKMPIMPSYAPLRFNTGIPVNPKPIHFDIEATRQGTDQMITRLQEAFTEANTEEVPKTYSPTALLEVCKQIHNEAMPILFDNTILFYNAYMLRAWINDIGTSVKYLTRLTLWAGGYVKQFHDGWSRSWPPRSLPDKIPTTVDDPL